MTFTLELPQDLEHELSAEARRLGLPLDEYALRLLSRHPSASGGLQTGADLVGYWRSEGVIGSRAEITDSAAHARQLRQRAERYRVVPGLLAEQPYAR